MTGKRIEKERSDTDAKVSGLGKFKAEKCETAEDGLHNLLSQKTNTTKSYLRYVICDRVVPAVFPDVATERMYQIRIYREEFGNNNWTVSWMPKEYLTN